MRAIILAGGSGTRLYPVTIAINKHFLPIYNKPMIYYPLSLVMLLGIKDVLFIVNPQDLEDFQKLFEMGIHTYVLDGDNIRRGINKDLDFSQEDREENIRRIGEISKLFVDAGIIVLSAFISPYKKDREFVRNLLEEGEFIEIYVKCSLDVCEQRDVKGLYKKARQGIIKNFTGIDDPYEEPENPEIVVETDKETLEESVEKIIKYLKTQGYLEL